MGRPPKLTVAQQAKARRRRAEGATLAELACSYDVGKSTISRLRRRDDEPTRLLFPPPLRCKNIETMGRVIPLTRTIAAVFAFLAVAAPAHADVDAPGNMFYENCMAAAAIMEGHASEKQYDKAPMCFGAVTAIINLEPFLKPEYAMCPPKGSKISYGQIILVIAAYLKNHPEQLDNNFHMLAVLALNTAWPCSTDAPK
jgi:hypothetical protein